MVVRSQANMLTAITEEIKPNEGLTLLIDCADKRFTINRPAAQWAKLYMDCSPYTMTRPGPTLYFQEPLTGPIVDELDFYINHGVSTIILNAHDDCLANPLTFEDQKDQLKKGLKNLLGYNPNVRVVCTYSRMLAARSWSVGPVYDSLGILAPSS